MATSTLWTAVLSVLIAGSAILTLWGEYRGPRSLVYVCKPLTTLLILALALQPSAISSSYRWLIAAGILCSLAGDIFLMLPQDRFIPGLLSFLVAHLLYIAAFRQPWSSSIVMLLIPFVLYGVAVMRILLPHLGKLTTPVIIYGVILLIMAWQASWRGLELGTLGSGLGAIGALWFVISDSALAYNRFARPFKPAQAVVLSTYFGAQWLIALSVLL